MSEVGRSKAMESSECHEEGFNFGGGSWHLLWTFSNDHVILCKPISVIFLWIRWIIMLMGRFTIRCINGTGGVQHQSEIVKVTKLLPWVLPLGHCLSVLGMFPEGRDLF